jgi:hypothetical protein
VAAAFLMAAGSASAGGPTRVSRAGNFITWDVTRPIPYTVDSGPLGRFSNAQAVAWVDEAFRRWSAPDAGFFTVAATAPSAVDITAANFVRRPLDDAVSANQVVFDADGALLNRFFGDGAGGDTLGITRISIDSQATRIVGAQVVINGNPDLATTPEGARETIQHELGHFLGLTHSQLNALVAYDGVPGNDLLAPVMSYSRGDEAGPLLHAEDRAWIAALYPRSASGGIRGRVLLSDHATGVQGIQVVARKVGEEEVVAVSGLSGYRYKHPVDLRLGSRDGALMGLFELPGLPPGEYRLELEPLEDEPVIQPAHGFLSGGRRYWREGGLPTTDLRAATPISVRAGQVTEGRDFVLVAPAPSVPRAVESEPNNTPEVAQPLPLSVEVTGRVGPQDAGRFDYDAFDGTDFYDDKVEDWYRIVVTEPTLLTATLTASAPAADLNLFLVSGDSSTDFPVGTPLADGADPGTPPERLQIRVWPGVYFLGVSSADRATNTASDYLLQLLTVPSPDLPQEPPRVTLLVASQITAASVRIHWQTDQETIGRMFVSRVGNPTIEVGSARLGRGHSLELTGLRKYTTYRLSLFIRNQDRLRTVMPDLGVGTARDPDRGAPFVQAGLWSVVPGEELPEELLMVARVTNLGVGTASRVTIDRLSLPAGWRFVTPPVLPLDLGEIGPGGSAIVALPAVRVSAGSATLDLSIDGGYTSFQGDTRRFDR